MENSSSANSTRQREQEIVNILIESDLYLGMDLSERLRLLRYIQSAYDRSSAE